MGEYYDPERALREDWRDFFYDHKEDLFDLPCVEGPVTMAGKWMLLNIMLCMPLIKRHRPISQHHLKTSGIYDAASHAKHMTIISRSLEEMGYTREDLGHDVIMTANNAHNMCYTHLGNYVGTMDIFSIAETVLQPEVKAVCTMDYGDVNDGNISRMQDAFRAQCAKVDELLSGNTLDINVFRAPLLCGSIKKAQFFQFVLSAGPKTDTDDHLFLRPVEGSFLSGFTGIMDLAIESRSAAKAAHYNTTQMANTQYNNRKIHIQGSILRYLYPGDCGTTGYMDYEPNKKTVKRYLGKFYLDGSGNEVELTEDKFESVIGKTIKFRSVHRCYYTDGYCERCGGTITKSFARRGDVGFLANVNTGAPIAQQVLSTKHLTSTDAAKYIVPADLDDFLMSITNDIFLRPSLHKKANVIALGLQQKDISRLNDLKYFIDEGGRNAAYFTDIKYMYLGILQDDGTVGKYANRTHMGGESKTFPHLSPEILTVIRDHPEDMIIQDNIAWLLLRHADVTKPIMQCTVINNSIRRFVKRFTDLITKDVERYHSMNDFMRQLVRLVWDEGKVETHITHIECLARSCLITSKTDYHIPVMTDPDNVMFGTLSRNIPMRSIGGLFAFQGVDVATNRPVTYITPKQSSIFDEFLGFKDRVDASMNTPTYIDKIHEVELEAE